MKKTLLFLVLFSKLFLFSQTPIQYVNPFIGTGGHGHTFPGATLPFAMVQLSPDTRIDNSWDGASGYHYSDSIVYGFSHTHLSGTGVTDWGDILVMPTINKESMEPKIYASKFHHQNEKASPGYYSMLLEDEKIKVELTTTLRTGIHRYTFPKNADPKIIVDLLHRDRTLGCNLKLIDSVTIAGYRISEAWAKEQHVYFTMNFSHPIKQIKYAGNKVLRNSINYKKGENAEGALIEFEVKNNEPLLIKVGLSSTNIEGSQLNLNQEASHWNFDLYKKDAEKAWTKELNKIEVNTNDKDRLITFYTSLYHCMIHPSLDMDVNGNYRGRDNKIHQAINFTHYTVFSLWDTYRALHPLFTIIDTKRTNDFLHTFLNQYDQSRRLPVWELSSNETDCMIGYHAASVIADAFVKGISNYDTVVIYQALKAASTFTNHGIAEYNQKSFLEVEDAPESVSKTLEYAYDDWCIAQVAQKLNKLEDYKLYIQRAQAYKNLFDPETGFMRPRKNGGWLSPFDPTEVNNNYTEANSWQYSFYVPQDLEGLIKLHGGESAFEKKLDELFSTSSQLSGRNQSDISGLIGQYAHGNEPSHHMAYLYNYVGKPEKTILYTHKIMNEFYKNSPDGIIGNEDCGQMSAWYVFSSMGFYPVTPGLPIYTLGLPLFNSITIHLENGKKFEISNLKSSLGSERTSPTSININGNKIYRSSIPHQLIASGGSLKYNFLPTTDTLPYGKKYFNTPKTRINNYPIIPAPIIKSASKLFRNTQEITLISLVNDGVNICYTTDGSMPTKSSNLYFKPFSIDSSCIINAKIFYKADSSKTSSASFIKLTKNWKVDLKSNYNKQYTADGDNGIIDGLYGDLDWRKGLWQGYQYQDFDVTIDLGLSKKIQHIASNYLQDSRSWILFPSEIEYSYSSDGKKFIALTTLINPVPASDYQVQTKKFEYVIPKTISARFIRIKAKNYGKLPSWHQGNGDGAFIFIDEIEIK